MEYIICLGDSLTYGARDEYHRSYPAELSQLYWERKKHSVYCVNHGINGETSSQLLRRAYQNLRSCPDANTVLILIETNDTFLPQNPEIYRDNLRQIITLSQVHAQKVGVGLLPPIIGPGLPNYPIDGQEQVNRFNQILRSEAETHGCFLADFTTLGSEIIDTVHFSHNGYKKMAEIWYDALENQP